jgi:hypothetical protein
VAPEAKFAPLIVSVKEGPPVVALDGEREMMLGVVDEVSWLAPGPLQPEITQNAIALVRKRSRHRELLPSVRLIVRLVTISIHYAQVNAGPLLDKANSILHLRFRR